MLGNFRLQQVERHVPGGIRKHLFVEIAGSKPPGADDLPYLLERNLGRLSGLMVGHFSCRGAWHDGQAGQGCGNPANFVGQLAQARGLGSALRRAAGIRPIAGR
jgi:hypothetical protein